MAKPANATGVRAQAARALSCVLQQGQSLADALPPAQQALTDRRDAALLAEICYGTLRWYFRLDYVLRALLSRPMKSRDADIRCLLLAGLYQLDRMAMPERVAIHETVQAVRALDKDWASGLVNAVLRNFQRGRQQLLEDACRHSEALHAHPDWLIERLRHDWPNDWAAILAANNTRPPFTLRVNAARQTRNEYLETLSQHALEGVPLEHAPQAVRLHKPLPVEALPGFSSGEVSVQDAAAQLAAGLLDTQPGQRVLDACAAPGGKTAHILESAPTARLDALDIDAERLARVGENLSRLSLQARLLQGDAAMPVQWWDGQVFEKVLLDVPCSATGVIRRHPDIKILRRSDDIDALVTRQCEILDAIWPLLAPGGMLLYCTCSVLKTENSGQVAAFIERHDDAVEVAIDAAWGHGCTHGRQIFPGENQMDGFYFACVRKLT